MMLIQIVNLVINYNLICSAYVNGRKYFGTGITPLEPDRVKHMLTWKESDKENLWELSGKYQGDIRLGNARTVVVNEKKRWPSKEIPVQFHSAFTAKQRDWILDCLKPISDNTCVKPRMKKDDEVDYVYFYKSPNECSSMVGRIGGRQDLNLIVRHPLGTVCTRCGTVVHEFLHALGFIHEQASRRRNDYVTIVWENIKPGKEYNFVMYGEDEITDLGEKYDYDSIMHYSAYAFSKNGKKTIVPKKRSRQIGQRAHLSDVDIHKINKMYCSKSWTRTPKVTIDDSNTKEPSVDNATTFTDHRMSSNKQSSGTSNVRPEHSKHHSRKRTHRLQFF